MKDAAEALVEAMTTLALPGRRIPVARDTVPNRPGLYAVHALPTTWRALELEERDPSMPLYVGRARDSLVTRDLKTHFATGYTGRSTVRRSFAVLLRDQLGIRSLPRRSKKPFTTRNFTNYDLDADSEQALTEWMHDHLTFSVWSLPEGWKPDDLIPLEKSILRAWGPPVNLRDVPHPSMRIDNGRKIFADEARAYAQAKGDDLGRS